MDPHAALVVDDEPASLRAVMRSLQSECRVLTTGDPAHALELITRESISLLIVDQRMPAMLGTELLAQAAAAQPQVVRMLLTGYTDVETLVEAINAGHVYAYITKPWEPGALRLIVRRAFERYDVEADRRRLLAQLQESCVQLRRESERRARVMTLASHELRTPVHLLAGALEILRAWPHPGDVDVWWQTADDSVAWLGRCLKQLDTVLQWDSGPPALHLQGVDVVSLSDHLLDAVAPIASQRRLALVRRLAQGVAVIRGDAFWLGQGLWCLLSNALRFTADGGTIEVSVQVTASHVRIEVRDSGIGIPPEYLGEVFEPFSRAAGDLSLHSSGLFEFGTRGLGLGLSIAKSIIERHDGCIGVSSTLGQGSVFTVELPVLVGRETHEVTN